MRSDARSNVWVFAMLAGSAAAQRIEPHEAMQLCCPGTRIERRVVALGAEQREEIGRRSGEVAPPDAVVRYEARRDGDLVAVGYLDAHRVRSKKQVLLVVVVCAGERAGRVERVEVLAFAEPRRYLPSSAFYEQFRGLALTADLREGRSIRRVTGATMTARATVAAVRRVLATHAELTPTPP